MELGPITRAMLRNKTRYGLIILEIAFTLAVVANCLAMIDHAQNEMDRSSGFDDDNIIHVRVRRIDTSFRDDKRLQNAVLGDLEVLGGTPGVVSVVNTKILPWIGGGSSTEARAVGGPEEMLRTQVYPTDQGLVDTLGVDLVEGREFTRAEVERDTERLAALFAGPRERDESGVPRTKFVQDVLISRRFAELAFGQGPYVGKLLEDKDRDQYRVIGVLDEFYNPYAWNIDEYVMFYAGFFRSYDFGSRYLVRTEPGQAAQVARTIEHKLTESGEAQDIDVELLTEVRSKYFGPQRMVSMLMGAVAALVLSVTALGIVGLTSFSVTERTRQIGTRRALGATTRDILRYFLLENWLLTMMGLAVGVGLAVGLNIVLTDAVAWAAKLDVGTTLTSVAVLWLAALLAAVVPALRAARISPAIATRNV